MVIRLGSMGLHDFVRALGVWSSGWAVWGYMTLLEPKGCGHQVGQYGVT